MARVSKNKMLLALLAKYMELNDMKYRKELADILNVSIQSINNKYKNPDTFTLPEIRALASFFKFTDEEKSSII